MRIRATLTPVELGEGAGIANLSTRAQVYPGDGALIAGFVVEGAEPGMYLTRGVEPSLQAFGIHDALVDPRLGVVPDNGGFVVGNDDWGTAPDVDALRAAMSSVGAFPLVEHSRDAAILIEATAGAHTAMARLIRSRLLVDRDKGSERPSHRLSHHRGDDRSAGRTR